MVVTSEQLSDLLRQAEIAKQHVETEHAEYLKECDIFDEAERRAERAAGRHHSAREAAKAIARRFIVALSEYFGV